MALNIELAIGGALASAFCFAISSVLQHRSAAQAPVGNGLHLGLLAHLMARPMWLLGILASIGTLALQIGALASGPLILVQLLLSTGLLFALPLSVVLEKRRPSPVEWSWAALLLAGLAIFLVAASPGAGPPLPEDRQFVILAAGAVTVGAIAAGIGYGPGRRHRAVLLGFATGIAYGLAATLIKYTVALGRDDTAALLTTWPAYVLIAVGTSAVLLNQAAYQAGPLAGALPAIVITDSIVAIIASAAAFHEEIATSAAALAFQVLGFCTMGLAIIALAKITSGRDALQTATSAK